jgi:hypothetical protein
MPVSHTDFAMSAFFKKKRRRSWSPDCVRVQLEPGWGTAVLHEVEREGARVDPPRLNQVRVDVLVEKSHCLWLFGRGSGLGKERDREFSFVCAETNTFPGGGSMPCSILRILFWGFSVSTLQYSIPVRWINSCNH